MEEKSRVGMMKDVLDIFNKNGQHEEDIAKWSLSAQ